MISPLRDFIEGPPTRYYEFKFGYLVRKENPIVFLRWTSDSCATISDNETSPEASPFFVIIFNIDGRPTPTFIVTNGSQYLFARTDGEIVYNSAYSMYVLPLDALTTADRDHINALISEAMVGCNCG